MAEYQLTETDKVILRTADGASIPNDPDNRAYAEYLDWFAGGGIPDPYVEPPPTIEPLSTEDVVFFNHENRLRGIEGKEPLTLKEFVEIKAQMRKNM